MRLEEWLSRKGISERAFARQLGVAQMTVIRYRRGDRIPTDPGIFQRIIELTDGEVQPNDFYLNLPLDAPRRRQASLQHENA